MNAPAEVRARFDEADSELADARNAFDAAALMYDMVRLIDPAAAETGEARDGWATAGHGWIDALAVREAAKDELATFGETPEDRPGSAANVVPLPSRTRRGR